MIQRIRVKSTQALGFGQHRRGHSPKSGNTATAAAPATSQTPLALQRQRASSTALIQPTLDTGGLITKVASERSFRQTGNVGGSMAASPGGRTQTQLRVVSLALPRSPTSLEGASSTGGPFPGSPSQGGPGSPGIGGVPLLANQGLGVVGQVARKSLRTNGKSAMVSPSGTGGCPSPTSATSPSSQRALSLAESGTGSPTFASVGKQGHGDASRPRKDPGGHRTGLDPQNAAEVVHKEAAMSKEDIADVELQAAAEQQTLQEEISGKNLTGFEALLYVLTAKLGSVKKAFQWFDASKTGHISNVEWDTGGKVLRVDMRLLTGCDSRSLFKMMDTGKKSQIARGDWIEFFEAAAARLGDELLSQAAGEHGTLAERAKRKKELLRLQKGAAGKSEENSEDFIRGLGKLSEEELSFRERMRRELSQLKEGARAQYYPEEHPELDQRKVFIIEAVAKELGLFAHLLEEGSSFMRGTHQSFEPSASQRATVGGVLVFNLADFAERTRDELIGIPAGGKLEYPTNLTMEQRQVVHLLAEKMGLWTHSEGKGAERRVVAFNAGDCADSIRQRLEALQPGESTVFPTSFNEAQRKMVHLIAAELQLWSYSQGEGDGRHVLVFNVADFAEKIRDELAGLAPGAVHAFDTRLTEGERQVIHCIASELHLCSLSQGEGDERFVSVANLRDFQAEVRATLEALLPGETHEFDKSLTSLHRKVIHEICTEMGLKSHSTGEGEERYVSVTRPDPADGPHEHRRTRSKSMRASRTSTKGINGEHLQLELLFAEYATGKYGGGQIFTSHPDLETLLEDMMEVMPQLYKQRGKLQRSLKAAFDDTLQMQVDFGTRTRKGLSSQWFRVFVQKMAGQAGLSATGLTFALLDNH